MSIFNKFKKSTAASREFKEQFYAVVAAELKAGIRRDGLWLMALEKSKGSEEKAKSHYITLRIQSLIDEANQSLVEQAERELQEQVTAEKDAEKQKAIEAQADSDPEERRLKQILEESIIILQDKGFNIRQRNNGWVVTSPKGQEKIIYEIEFLHKYATAQ